MKFLNENAFQTPTMFLKPDVLRRLEPSGTLTRIRTAQLRVLTAMLQANRLTRLNEQVTIDSAQSYSPVEYLADVRQGIFTELSKPSVKIDAFRRNLQRAYIDLIASRLNSATRLVDEQRPLLRGELQSIASNAKTGLLRAADRETRLHLEDLRDEIAKVLDPKYQPPTPPVGAAIPLPSFEEEGCFVDYAIR
ncbi:MAG: zinc-dependent metalloprotease [Acidobacteriota bacterium]